MKAQTFEGHYAGFVSRLFAFGIDALVIVLIVSAIGVIFSIIDNIFILPSSSGGGPIQIDPLSALSGLFMSIIATVYFPFFWVFTGHTPGMFLMGLTTVTLDGGSVSFWRAVVRTVGFFLSAFVFFLGFLWILIDNRRQGWHDKMAGTCVIYNWPARPDENFLRKRLDSG
jgi:uncharacterized RDD family membrane protein YckC